MVREAVRLLEAGADAKLPEREFEFYPTPTHTDARNRGVPSQLLRRYIPLSCRLRILPDRRFDTSGGRMNPVFLEWLMAWPMSWTDLRPLETDRLAMWLLGRSPTSRPDSGKEDGYEVPDDGSVRKDD